MFDEVTIIGAGLLGASLGLALKKHCLARRVIGVGRPGSTSLDTALERHAIDAAFTALPDALRTPPDLVILCTPVRQFPDALRTLGDLLPPTALITDVGSTKAQVMTWAQDILGKTSDRFVGSHPMAGSEKRGPAAARDDLYDGGLCLLCQSPADTNGTALARIEALWQALNMRTRRLEPALHDRWVATVSHLPHAVAFTLMNTAAAHPEMLDAAAGGFLDTTRIASSDPDMWTDIFLTNREAILSTIDAFTGNLAALRSAIIKGDEPTIREALTRARAARGALLARRKGPSAG